MVKICIIGAGAAGIVTAKLAMEEGHMVSVFEQCSEIGGTWYYTEDTGVHTAMYEVMKTNLPKEIMLFSDVKFPDALPSFMDHQDVFRYLKDYAKKLPILLNHTVTNVEHKDGIWEVTVTSDVNVTTEHFDVVFVCNGHFFHPSIPIDPSRFKGTFLHSHDYRKVSSYSDRRVVIMGAGPSGIDIAMQAAEYAQTVYLIGSKANYTGLTENLTNIVQLPVHITEIFDNSVVLSDGTVLESIDDIVACTEYEYKFPFLSDELISISADGQMVSPLYEHIQHTEYPSSLLFIGLNSIVVKFTLFEQQAKYAMAVIGGRSLVENEEEMKSWQIERLRSLQSNGKSSRQFHVLGDEEWDYFDRLADLGNFPRWDFYRVMRRIFDTTYSEKSKNVYNYKKINFKMNGDWTDFEVVK